MFNWVCPRCGKDVPPSKTECPYCPGMPQQAAAPPPPHQAAGWQSPAAAPQAWQPPAQPVQQWAPAPPSPPPPPPPVAAAPPHQYPPPPPYAQPGYAAPPQAHWPQPKQGPPAWLVGGAVFVGLLLVLSLGYYWMQPSRGKSDPAPAGKTAAVAGTPQEKAANPFQKYVEVVGIRLVQQEKKSVARFVVVNHSSADISGLEANVTLWASTSRSEEDAVGTFTFKAASVGPNGSVDVTAPLTTKLKPYELPDWQHLTAEIQITSPRP